MYTLKKIVGSNNFSTQIKIISHYKRLAIILMYCNRLHAWWSTQSRLATLLSSLIARRWVGLRLKGLSSDEMVGAVCFGCCQAHRRLPVGFLLLPYSVSFTVESLSLLYSLLCLNLYGHFPIGILGQVWCLIVLIPDLCPHSFFDIDVLHPRPMVYTFRNLFETTFCLISY